MSLVYGEVASGREVHGPSMLVASSSVPQFVTQVMTTLVGGVPSPTPILRVGRRTITWKLQLLVLPQASVAVATTVLVLFRLKRLPEGGEEVTVTDVHASVAIMDQVTETLLQQVITVMLDGQKIVGLLVSLIVTIWLQLMLLLQQSVACQVRIA